MNTQLWQRILEFEFDQSFTEYGFSTRLAGENEWTRDFTRLALLEYKKFMYLAATSNMMVSPSEIVDQVWHQHLTYSQSYNDFCNLLGKSIQHIPSTHSQEEMKRFKAAKSRTSELYQEAFGDQPPEIWACENMLDSLQLPKAKIQVRSAAIIGILVFLALIMPFFYLLKPVYVHIKNPYFLLSFGGLAVLSFIALEFFNRAYLRSVVRGFPSYSFIRHLHSLELVYLKTLSKSHVVHASVSRLVEEGKIDVYQDRTIELYPHAKADTVESHTIMESLRLLGRTPYPNLVNLLVYKPVFGNVAQSMYAFKKYFIRSKVFLRLFFINFIVLSFVLLLGLTRLLTGIARDKPVEFIGIAIVVLSLGIFLYLSNIEKKVCTGTIPFLYKNEILPNASHALTMDWQYFLFGISVLPAGLIPMVNLMERDNSSSGGGSCGSSCGGGCGGGCGGCGS